MNTAKKTALAFAAAGLVTGAASGSAFADAGAQGEAKHSPGVISGNVVQVPLHVPVNVCGNTVSVIGALDPAFGNACANSD
ncbi:chaplin [Streptomyces mauvecolor]